MEQVDTEIDSVYSAILKSTSIRFQWHSVNIIMIIMIIMIINIIIDIELVQNIHRLTAVTNYKSLSQSPNHRGSSLQYEFSIEFNQLARDLGKSSLNFSKVLAV